MTLNELRKGYLHAFMADGLHIRDERSGIDLYFQNMLDVTYLVALPSIEGKDWITDFRFFFRRWTQHPLARTDSPVRVHRGFLEGYLRIRDQVLKLPYLKHVVVTGFSMGGGVAPIVALDLSVNLPDTVVSCVAVGGPRVFNKAGQESFNRRVPDAVRIEYGNDVVTKIPPFYKAVGKLAHVGPARKWWKLSVQDHIDTQDTPHVDLFLANLPWG